jgi:hypothetical protein
MCSQFRTRKRIFSHSCISYFIHSLLKLTALSEVIHVYGKMTTIQRSRVPQIATHLFSQVSSLSRDVRIISQCVQMTTVTLRCLNLWEVCNHSSSCWMLYQWHPMSQLLLNVRNVFKFMAFKKLLTYTAATLMARPMAVDRTAIMKYDVSWTKGGHR